jgi:CO dehydrogenase maturation factor
VRGIIRELGAEDGAIDTVIDMEAGLEHLSRGTSRHTDVLLSVAEPYYRSLETAARTAELGVELGIPRVAVVANKLQGERDEASVREVFEQRDLRVLGEIPFDETVLTADRHPSAPIDVDPRAPAVVAVEALADAVQAWQPTRSGEA